MAEFQQFGRLVAQMLDTDNTKRKEAEDQYEKIDLSQKITLLFQLYLERSASEDIRSMALVLTRRLWDFDFEAALKVLSAEQQGQYIEGILHAATEEPSLQLQKKLADVISQFAMNMIDEESGVQKCGKIIQFIEHCNSSANANLKVVAMSIIEEVPNVFGLDQDKYLPGIKAIFQACLVHEAVYVRSAAVKAFFYTLLIWVCQHIVTTSEDDDVPLQSLCDLVTTVPKTLTPYLNDILVFALTTVKNTELEESYRHTSLEIIASFCEAAPNMIKKRAAQLIPTMLEVCILSMTDLEDDTEDWLSVDDADEDVEEDNAALGETSLDRICCALGGKATFQPALAIVSQLLNNGDWKKRHAAIFTLSTIGEGCKSVMEAKIVEIVEKVIPYLLDEHPRVRYAACNALGQMSTDFEPTLQKKCHEKVVPALVHTLLDLSVMRVAAHAGAALVNFSEECPKNIISNYLPDMMSSLEQVLEATYKHLVEKNKKLVLEQVITTIASVADAAEAEFIHYYDRMIVPLKFILQNSGGDDYKLLRGKTIECVSLIGLAVGREKFANDGQEIMNMLADTMPNLPPDDPQTTYMISSWTRICKVLGPLFAPYLPLVMPPIIRSVEYAPEVTVVDDSEANEDDPAWSFTSVGDNRSFGIRTAGIEEKVTACEMLVCYARELKEMFGPYVEQVLPHVLKNLKFMFHEGVRESSAEVLPAFLECFKQQGPEVMYRLWQTYYPALEEALNSEHDLDERRNQREAKEVDEDADPEDAHDNADEDQESDANLLGRVSDLFHACFKSFGPTFYPMVQSIIPGIVAMIDQSRDFTDRQWAVCMVDDLIEFAPKEAQLIQQAFAPRLVECLKDQHPEVRQATSYGFGVMALQGTLFTDVCVQVLPLLAEMISQPDARATEEGTTATENAISAVAKILKHCGGQIDQAQAIPLFLSWLPTWNDPEESVHIYGFFADLVESNNAYVLGENNSGLPLICRIVVLAFHNGAFDDEDENVTPVKTRLSNILRTLAQDHAVFSSCIQAAGLNEAEQATVNKIVS
ncbi:unnamed protein product, partial [Mesorhabditis belari]|uniref:IPO4/5-like TPR repeats domain-containing protein n=1 Tax=Mesorhabditis belari TaxID=2138241 RepID=A0AAF3FHQ7_9BILA